MKKHLQKALLVVERDGPDVLMVVGAGIVSFGVGMVYRPAGVITAGLFLLVAGVAWAGGRK